MDLIYIPRPMIKEIIDNDKKPDGARLRSMPVCVKIPYKGLVISIATEFRHSDDDLESCGIRVYKGDKDVTSHFGKVDTTIGGVAGTGEVLSVIMAAIDAKPYTILNL